MNPAKADIFARLQQDILRMQGYKPSAAGAEAANGLGRINAAFPNGVFPRAALHEFVCADAEGAAASGAFVSALLSGFMNGTGAAVWIGPKRLVYPPALQAFGVRPETVLFVELRKEKDRCWAVEEALKCAALSAVVGELNELGFTEGRRLQLAIEASSVPAFILRRNPKDGVSTATARWQIRPLQSRPEEGLPGLGHPRWRVQLLKVRNGRPGSWDIEWTGRVFRELPALEVVHSETPQRKAG